MLRGIVHVGLLVVAFFEVFVCQGTVCRKLLKAKRKIRNVRWNGSIKTGYTDKAEAQLLRQKHSKSSNRGHSLYPFIVGA